MYAGVHSVQIAEKRPDVLAADAEHNAVGRRCCIVDPISSQSAQQIAGTHTQPFRNGIDDLEGYSITIVVVANKVVRRKPVRLQKQRPFVIAQNVDSHVTSRIMYHTVH